MSEASSNAGGILRKSLKYTAFTLLGVIVVTVAGVLIFQQVSDGPYGPLQGGPLKTGEIVRAPVTDWRFVADTEIEEFQFELLGFGTSRITGVMVHDGELYIPCDLGYMWNRFDGRQRLILNVLYVFKRWHTDAEQDGRTLLRINGRLYPGRITRVEDPALDATLRRKLEAMAREWLAPEVLGPAPRQEPNDIWFFRFGSDPSVLDR